MSDGERLKRLVSFTPFTWDEMLGMAISYFLTRQNPESIRFKEQDDRYTIEVETDKENVEKAADFFEEYVAPEISKRHN